MSAHTLAGRAFRMLTTVGEYSRECLAIEVDQTLTSDDLLKRPSDLFVRRGVQEQIRSTPVATTERSSRRSESGSGSDASV